MKKLSADKKQQFIIVLLMITIAVLWGLAWVYMKAVLEYMGPFMFTFFRFGIGAIALIFIAWSMKYGLPERRYWKHLFWVGALQTAGMFLLVMYGLKFVEAGKSSVLLYSMPLWSSLLAVKYLQEKLSPRQVGGLFLGMIGLLTILGWDIWIGLSTEILFGELLIIIAAFLWAIANIHYRLHLDAMPKIQASAYQMVCGSAVIAIFAFTMEGGEPIVWTAASIYYVLFTGLLASALCFTVWYVILNKVSMVSATIATLLVPIFGLVFSSLMLAEPLTASILAGTGMIIGGIFIAQMKKEAR